MNGLELSRSYFEEYGRPMLEEKFPDQMQFLAVGSVGRGSDRFGYDDEVSRDHDFEPGFCIFLPGEDVIDRRTAFAMERAYAKLPGEYMGVQRQRISPVGGNRNGVMRTAEFYAAAVGDGAGALSTDAWLQIPDYALAEATNGQVFFDHYGEFTGIRQRLMEMPRDVLLKRLSGNLLLMAQSGQYNFLRCMRHGEKDAAQLACCEFVNAAMKVFFLLKGKYLPYYKWSFRAMRELDSAIAEKLGSLLAGDNAIPEVVQKKYDTIESIAGDVIQILEARELTQAVCGDLEKHAYSVNDRIADGAIRNMNILSAV